MFCELYACMFCVYVFFVLPRNGIINDGDYLVVIRSTKGASKQRRDAINDRVSQIRELLPVSEAARARLSQLQVMALARSFIAKSNLFSRQYTVHICCNITTVL